MNPRVPMILILVAACELFFALGQFLFKKTVNRIHKPKMSEPKTIGRFFRRVLTSPNVWLGLAVMTAGLVIWLAALSEGELSFVYPIATLQYIFVLFAARFFLKEKVDRSRVVGTMLVILGIILITVS